MHLKKVIRHIVDDVEGCSDDFDDSDEDYVFLISTLSLLLFSLFIITTQILLKSTDCVKVVGPGG